MKIPIWGLVDADNQLVFYATKKKECIENRWSKDEKIIPLMIVKRKTK